MDGVKAPVISIDAQVLACGKKFEHIVKWKTFEADFAMLKAELICIMRVIYGKLLS